MFYSYFRDTGIHQNSLKIIFYFFKFNDIFLFINLPTLKRFYIILLGSLNTTQIYKNKLVLTISKYILQMN